MRSISNRIYIKYNFLQKHTIYLIVILLSGLLINGCENSEPEITNIGILLFGDSRQPQVNGFIDEMSKTGFDTKSTNYTILNAKNNRKVLAEMVQELIDKKPDLLVAAGGLEADTMKKMSESHNIPVVVLYVNAIIERGLVKSRSHTGWNATGVDNLNAEISGKRIELIKGLLPDTKRVLILYFEKIAPSRIGVQEAKKVAGKLGITIDARAVKSRKEIIAIISCPG